LTCGPPCRAQSRPLKGQGFPLMPAVDCRRSRPPWGLRNSARWSVRFDLPPIPARASRITQAV
jgi:hypothetical protein